MPKKMGAKLDKRSIENLKAGLKEYHNIAAKLKTIDKVMKAPLRIKKGIFTKMGREEKRILLRDKVNEACNADAYGDIDKLIGLTHQSYNRYKALPGTELNTHEYITDQAIAPIRLDPTIANTLHTYWTYPDDPQGDMSDLIFEGQFYGKTSSGVPGNYPAVPYVDHYFFEKFASQYLYDDPKFKISRATYNKFKAKTASSSTQPESFALEITGMATPYIKYIETDSHGKLADSEQSGRSMDAEIDKLNISLLSGKNEEWEKAIVGAIPLAVYASIYCLRSSRMDVLPQRSFWICCINEVCPVLSGRNVQTVSCSDLPARFAVSRHFSFSRFAAIRLCLEIFTFISVSLSTSVLRSLRVDAINLPFGNLTFK
jgi:hypothetical protein